MWCDVGVFFYDVTAYDFARSKRKLMGGATLFLLLEETDAFSKCEMFRLDFVSVNCSYSTLLVSL